MAITAKQRLLIIQAQRQILDILALIQAEKAVGEWDKENPWVNRASDGKFSTGGGKNSLPEKSTNGSEKNTDSPIGDPMAQADQVSNNLSKQFQGIPPEQVAKAQKLWNSPEIQKIHKDTMEKLDSISKNMADGYDKTIKSTELDPKKVIDSTKKALDEIKAKKGIRIVGEIGTLIAIMAHMNVLNLAGKANKALNLKHKETIDKEVLNDAEKFLRTVIKLQADIYSSEVNQEQLDNAIKGMRAAYEQKQLVLKY